MPELLHKALTANILRAYYNVYNGTSRIYPERFYDRALVYELSNLDIQCQVQPEWQIFYKEKLVGKQILDVLIANEVVVENKVATDLTRLHKAQLLSYLKTTNKQVGLLLNFGSPKPEFERLFFTPREPPISKTQIDQAIVDAPRSLIAPDLVYEIIGGLYEVHGTLGPGFIHRIYANACYHEFRLRGLPVKAQKSIRVYYHDLSLGELKFAHLQIGDTIMVFPAAIQNPADVQPALIFDWLRTQKIALGIFANFYETSLAPKFFKTQSA